MINDYIPPAYHKVIEVQLPDVLQTIGIQGPSFNGGLAHNSLHYESEPPTAMKLKLPPRRDYMHG